jgi:hypothetical protein
MILRIYSHNYWYKLVHFSKNFLIFHQLLVNQLIIVKLLTQFNLESLFLSCFFNLF